MGKTGKIAIVVIGALALGWFYATPYLAVNAMKNAALERDAEGITSRVDFPALKENIKGTLSAKIMSEAAANTGESDPMAGAGAALGMMMIGPMIDNMITPEAVSMMMRSGKLGQKNDPESASKADAEIEKMDTSLGYRDFNTFAVTVRDPDDTTQEPMTMLFKRHGLASWKLSAVELPL